MEDTSAIAPTGRDGWLIWEVPGKPVSVWLSPQVVGRLAMAVREGFKALPHRGLETGGLLIGTRREAANQVVVHVHDFEPVESEHAAGPSYLLSNADRRLLEAKIAAREAASRKASVVGFYRSHTRRDFAITVEDASLFSNFFRKASDVFLLIKSNDGGPPTGGFIIREGGKVLSHTPYIQFTLDRTLVVPAAGETPVPALQTLPALPALPAPPRPLQAVSPPAPPRTPGKVKVKWPIWLAAAGALVLAVGLPFGIQRRIPRSLTAKPRPLALNVINTGNGLRLSWDHPALRQAGQAVLWIKDGQQEKRFELDSKQLNDGSVTYWPSGSDVDFRLELHSPGGSVTESVRAIGAPSPALVAAAAPAVEPSPVSVSSPNPPPNAPRRNQAGTASRQLARTFALPQPDSPPAPTAPVSLPDPPTIRPAAAQPLETIIPAISQSSRDAADPSFRVKVEPVSGSRLEHLARNIPLLGRRYRRSDYVPPAPLRNPALPNPPHRKVAQDVNIDVKVYVNPYGKVDNLQVLSKVAETDRDLADLATFSARRCEFAPARSGDGAVPGEVILHYQFGPGAH